MFQGSGSIWASQIGDLERFGPRQAVNGQDVQLAYFAEAVPLYRGLP